MSNHHYHRQQQSVRISTSLEAVTLPPATGWIVGHVIAGALASPIVIKASRKEDGWYRKIQLPEFTPPDRLFAPVWTTLYALMGWSAYQVFAATKTAVSGPASSLHLQLPMLAWWMHIGLNLLWAPLFFGLQMLRIGLGIQVVLLATLGWVMVLYHARVPWAAYRLIPYLLWLLFATNLNRVICKLNPGSYNNARFHADLQKLQQQAEKYAFQ